MNEILSWLSRYSPGVVLLIALSAGLLYLLRLGVERGVAAGFAAHARARDLELTRRSGFEERILMERYTLVTSLAARLERLATQLNRVRAGGQAPDGFRDGAEVVPLTELFGEIVVHRLALGEDLFEALHQQAQLLLRLARAGNDAEARELGERWLAAGARLRKVAEEQFRIHEIRF
jgi:hypothetical protein